METILTKRPIGMDFDSYKNKMVNQKKSIKEYLKRGTLVYKAIELTVVNGIVLGKKTYPPFVGNTKTLKAI